MGRYARGSDKQKIAEGFSVHGPVLADFGPSLKKALRIALDRSSPKVNSCETEPAEALEILNTQDCNDQKAKATPA